MKKKIQSWQKRVLIAAMLAIGVLATSCARTPETWNELLRQIQNESPSQKQAALEQFVLRNHWPLVKDSTACFVFYDTTGTPVYLSGDFTEWKADSLPMRRIPGTDYYYLQKVFPYRARLEYKFVVGKRWLLDPLNPYRAHGGFGENSVLMMPGYVFPAEALLRLKWRQSTLDTLTFKSWVLKNKRKVYVYRHPRSDAKAPLLVVQDGGDYLRFAKARIILDNLIGSGKIHPVNVLFVDAVNRRSEYWLNDRYLRMVFKELIPWAKQKFRWQPQSIGIGGASLGGEISLYALKDYGTQIGQVFSQSGALWIEQEKLLDIFEKMPQFKAQIFASYGLFESPEMTQSHKRFEKILSEKKINYRLRRFPQGHNWGNWRDQLSEIFEYFYGSSDHE